MGTARRASSAHELLVGTPLGRKLDADALASLTVGSAERSLRPGETLVVQGETATAIYLLARGELEVTVETGDGEHHVATLGPGAVIGEIALLAGDLRSTTVRAATSAAVVEVDMERMRALLRAKPEYAAELARSASERLRRTQFITELSRLFENLPSDALAALEGLIEWVTLAAGEPLFREGEDADAAYLVVTGRLRIVRGTEPHEQEVAEIGRGEMVGEIALLEDQPRNASVYAVRDSHLVRLEKPAYDALLERHPAAGLVIARTVLRRSRVHSEVAKARPRSVVVVPAGDRRVGDELVDGLVDALGSEARVVSSSDVDRALGVSGIAQVDDADLGAIRLGYWLDELQHDDDFVIFRIDDGWTNWSRRALRQSDVVLVVADADTDPSPSALEAELHRLMTRHRHPRVSLALVHRPGTELPRGTRLWTDQRPLASHHHIRRGDRVTIGRLARLLSGSGTSLVLGGGGARGFAHLGVYSVLEDEGVDVDMVGGTSIGSVMAAIIGLGWSADRAQETAVEQFRKLFDYTLPAVSLLRGERITSKLRSFLDGIDIADLWVPFFCASTDLTAAGVHFHDKGDLVQAIRASIAIPGILPPVPLDGHLLVDGGVLDNVPVEEMRRRNPTGRILAVDVAPVEGPTVDHDYGLSVAGVGAWRQRRRGEAAPPSVLTTMVRSSLVGSVRDRERIIGEQLADLYLDLAVEGGGLLDFSAAEVIAEAGAASARPVLQSWLVGDGKLGRYVRTEPAVALSAPSERAVAVEPGQARSRMVGVLLLTLRDLQMRAVRFAAVIAGTAVVFTLLFLMTGLVEQFHREPRDTVAAFGASGWLLREGSSGAFTSAATMAADTGLMVTGAGATPVVIARHSIDDGAEPVDVVVVGVPTGGLGEPTLTEGAAAVGPAQLVIDDSAGVAIGEQVSLGGSPFTVTGLTDRTTMFAGMPLVYLDIATAQALVYRGQPLATAVLLDGQPTAVPTGFVVLSPEAVAADGMRPLERSISSVNLIRVLLWFVAAMIIGTMIYLSALERRRDVAVLTAVGASRRQMGSSIALQGALTGLTAAVVAAGLQSLVVPVFPLEVAVPARALLQVPALAVLVSLIAGGIGLRTALRTDPALAFAGPGG